MYLELGFKGMDRDEDVAKIHQMGENTRQT